LRALALVVVLLLSGCAGGHADAVHETAEEWRQAVRAGDWASACDLMAPVTVEELEKSAKKPCAEALPDEATEPAEEAPEVSAYGKSGQASWRGETVFLGDFDGSWLVWAASCRPAGADEPYDCDISGG
jgi:hypothetical protein